MSGSGFISFPTGSRPITPELSPRKHFLATFRQIYYYGFGIFKGDPNPFHVSIYRKFNPLQSMTYQLVMMLCSRSSSIPASCCGTWSVSPLRSTFFGGVRVIDTVHVLIFIFFVFYVFVHVYLGTLGHTRTAHFKAMLTGYEDVDEEAEPARRRRNPRRRPASDRPV